MSKVISAQAFMAKATRIIEIPGFVEGEVISVRVKSVSVTDMITNGKLPNSLLKIVNDMFQSGQTDAEKIDTSVLLEDTTKLKEISNMMRKVAAEALLEPKYEDVKEGLTDAQIQSIYTQASGHNVDKVAPISGE